MNELKQMARDEGIYLTDEMLRDFATYQELLLDWNNRMNLTAITEPRDILIKHFLDSILLLRWCEIPQNAKVIDVGTGAGFPGIPLKIVRPDLQLTLLDSLQKRVTFLTEVSRRLNLDNQCIHSRAEDLAHEAEHREQYDVATARAVASLPALSELCLPFVKRGGYFLAMKGPDSQEEMEKALRGIHLLGGAVKDSPSYTLPDGSGRALYIIEKTSQTPTKYPRKRGKITKAPLI